VSQGDVVTDLVAQARAGDEEAFRRLVHPYAPELQVHCYRILGTLHDAEDALQDTLLAAWRGLAGFEERASMRTWLYRIATSRSLNALRSVKRHREVEPPLVAFDAPEPTRMGEVLWLEPYPDALLDGMADTQPGPEARYEAREAISLAFVTALQLLPPRQRAVLILRDVLGFHAAEVAAILDTTAYSVTSALKRARATLRSRLPAAPDYPPLAADSPAERALVEQLTRAYDGGDVEALVALLSENVAVAMPPRPLEYHGRPPVARFFAVLFGQGRTYRLHPAPRANGDLAFGIYLRRPGEAELPAAGLMVVGLAGDRVASMTRFDNGVLRRFGLPLTLTD
jgi:RNA polymerase sigma-70 factor (TIGR02960 family)